MIPHEKPFHALKYHGVVALRVNFYQPDAMNEPKRIQRNGHYLKL